MNSIIDKFALKQIVLYLEGKSLRLKMVDPQNSDELNELKKLDKKGCGPIPFLYFLSLICSYVRILLYAASTFCL